MTNITKAINGYIGDVLDTGVIYNDEFPTPESEGVISRHDPSTAKSKTYIDGSEEGTLNIAYWARYKNAAKARETLNDIINAIDNEKIETDEETIYTEAQTLPQFVSTDDKGYTLYTASITAEYER